MENSEQTIDPAPYRPSRRRLITTLAIGVTVLSALIIAGVVPRLHAAAEAQSDRERAASETAKVQVEKPSKQGASGKVVLPGTVQAVQDAVIYARTSGYVRSYAVDIGDAVKAGQVLATLDTPEVDQELRAAEAATQQARANIEQARTQLDLASKESSRYQSLAGHGVVSQQDMEEHRASYDARGASLKAMEAARGTADANLQRLRELKGFATVVAPFDGVVTTRAIELGQLVASGTGQAMFHVANTATMRVFVNVPQSYASSIKVGDSATIGLRELPQRPFTGTVTRTSRALDPATRTLLTEIRIPNPDGALLPGMYAELTLAVNRVEGPLTIRPSALVADASGTRVAVVERGAIKWHTVKIDSDLGDQVAVLSGIAADDDIVVAPSERLADGMRVTSEPAPRPAAPAPAPAPAKEREVISRSIVVALVAASATSAVAEAPRRVSFDEAIQLAMDHAADARIAAAEVARAQALLTEAASTLRPIVGLAATYQQLEGDRTVSGRETAAGESFLGQLTVSMPLLNFRERADRQRAADQLEVERAAAATVRRGVAIQAGRAYLAVFAAKRILEVAGQARETAAAHVAYATQRTTGGIGTELDIVRAQAELATDESNLATAQTAVVQAEEALGVITGQVAALESSNEPALDGGDDVSGVAHRADVIAGERRLSSAEWSRKAQWAEWMPTLSINGNGFYAAPQIDPVPRVGFQVLGTLAMPLYDGGFRDGLRQERDAVLAEAREELAQIERTANSEARAARDAVGRAREARAAAHRSAELAARALELANVAYTGGTGTSLEVIDAQRSARDAATQAAIADDGLREASFSLRAATGHVP